MFIKNKHFYFKNVQDFVFECKNKAEFSVFETFSQCIFFLPISHVTLFDSDVAILRQKIPQSVKKDIEIMSTIA